ncbi:phenazine biosynthesis-like domain-containing protein isoform X2 [Dreissena polymorpha]|uniref:phenazine biosynthesis-like domain-containing protein isoform X2 n=1 Tax=Dreissena polymorpha TaxID=45954 RepID=UPI0022642679|nr:phenazine biosynthesis-like domain-containing protein isoform X2 [Dreissena polymorpha]
MADLPIFIVDAFTREPFAGNPAAVCLLLHDQTMKDGLLQKIASEMNLSETAYVQCLSENGSFEKVCAGLHRPERCRYVDTPPWRPLPRCSSAQEICGLEHVSDVQYSRTTRKLLVRLKDELTRDFLEGLAPDPRALQASDISGDVMGVIVTLKGHPDEHGYDFFSRYFAPWNGIPEDPVTGSAHTVLADYWSKQLGKTSFKARQCSQRGGDLEVNIAGNRVELTGNARVVLKGTLSNVDLDC